MESAGADAFFLGRTGSPAVREGWPQFFHGMLIQGKDTSNVFCVSVEQPDGESSGTMPFPCIRESFHLQARRFFPGRMVGQFFQQKGDAGFRRAARYFFLCPGRVMA